MRSLVIYYVTYATLSCSLLYIFFFQAEDGIRDYKVTGVQTCALPILEKREGLSAEFLGHIRNADALAIVLRTFANSNVPHIYGDIDPNRDLDSLYAELDRKSVV